jgi:hypothetical protein
MMSLDPEFLLRRQNELEGQRANFDTHWQEVQDFVLPQSLGFITQTTPGQKKMERVFDSTPITANEHFAAAMQSMLTPATERWHKIVPIDQELEDDYEVTAWCDEVTNVVFRSRYAPRAQFGQAIGEGFLAFGAFGNAVVLIEDRRGEHLVYRAGHPKEYYFVENEWGVVDTMHRKFRMSAANLAAQFGVDVLPEGIRVDATRKPDQLYDVLHVVTPRDRGGYGPREAPGMAFASCYVAIAGKKELRRSGYRSFPYAIGRYQTTAGEVYGRGPGMTALPDIKTLNEMMKTILRAGQKVVDPPVLLQDGGALGAFQLRTGALNRGYVNADGKPLAHPFVSGARLDIGLEMVQDVRRRIDAVFKVDLFRILVDKPTNMTATEALIRAQEKGALLAPTGQRTQGEFLGGMVARELDILRTAGQLPSMPDALMQRGGASAIKVEFSAPINQAQKAQKGVAINTFLSALETYAAIDPSVMDNVDADEVVREMRDVAGAPQKIIRPPKDVEALRAKKQEQADMANAIAAAEQTGAAAKDWATAQATARAQPPNLGAGLQ